jgi:hypothetical protein
VAVADGRQNGKVRIYEYNDTSWAQLGDSIDLSNITISDITNTESRRNRVSLSSDGTRISVGNLNGGANEPGNVKVYEYNNSSWNEIANIVDYRDISNEFGYSTSISRNGHKVASVAPSENQANVNSFVRISEILKKMTIETKKLQVTGQLDVCQNLVVSGNNIAPIIFHNLPISDPGISGALWRDNNGFLRIS